MAQRSPYNDRYKTDQKGKTLRSASAAKPKRVAADVTPAEAAKKSEKRSSAWSRAKAASASSSSSSSKGSGKNAESKSALRTVENSPRMKQLRRIWWWLWGGAVVLAVALWLVQEAARTAGTAAEAVARTASGVTTATVDAAVNAAQSPYAPYLLIGWALWLAAMAGAFYLEFGPIRKERAAGLAAVKSASSSKSKKSGKGGSDDVDAAAKPKSKGKPKALEAPADEPVEEDDFESKDAE